MKPITPFLWFDTQAEAAARFYVSVFKNSRMGKITYYMEDWQGMAKGTVMSVSFNLNGQDFTALNGGPLFQFNEAISFVVPCDTQAEIDDLWEKLTADGGQEVQCGWLKDKYGVSWQIVPAILNELTDDPEKGAKVMQAILGMKKLDIAQIQEAAK